ncbi:MAG: response regulator [Snowella sp.]|nr:response regulator [Snowella sp.]
MDNQILVVEDSDEDFNALSRIMGELGFPSYLRRVCDGDEALDYLYQRGSYKNFQIASHPSIILLDLNLPGTDGKEVIQQVKQDDHLKRIPIVVLTTSNSPQDIKTCYNYGANSYLIKPMGIKKFKETVSVLCEYWLKTVILP